MEEIIAENRIRYAQRGDYACLVQGAGSTARRGIEVEPRLLDLTKHTTEKQSITTHVYHAMHSHMMS